jgi:hypothetical protein
MSKTSLVERKGGVYMEMDRRDQLQIVAEAMGEVVDELVYDVQGKKGLSYKGVNTIGFYMGDIGVQEWVDWQRIQMEDRFYWSATVKAYNERYNLTALGTAEAPEMMEVYDRDEKRRKIPDGKGGYKTHLEFDKFCRRKALSMAQRNAKRAVIPEPVLLKWLNYFWDKKQGRDVEPPFEPKSVDAEYTVMGTQPKDEKTPARPGPPPSKPKKKPKEKAKKKGEKKPKPKEKPTIDMVTACLSLGGFNKKKVEKLLEIKEDEKYLVVALKDDISDEDYYRVEQALASLNPEYRDTGGYGEFYIEK